MFKYCSDLHEEIVSNNISRLSKFQTERLDSLGSVIDDDYTIWLLSNDWFDAIAKSESERFNVAKQQLDYMMAQCGPMLNLLSDMEWAYVESQWNRHLFSIRTFNTHFLGYFWSKGLISEIGVDGLNIAGWKYASYFLFANEVYQKLRPRIINKNECRYISNFNMDEFTMSNYSMTTIQSNFVDVMTRFKMGNDVLEFIKAGMIISNESYKNSSHSDWARYYESQEIKPDIPNLTY